ncbi:MAG: glycine oxidase ThiO [Gallionella sp.]|nr:glycine oxidase ThiO [Gallionella sp.]MDD4946901.1 glycine oxidase ThiO [Gallionella sp.]MDD5612547.1 glycine oxidase ThiO [Gallionella sp.]
MASDFLIIGGGAVGLASALSLLEAGYDVTLAERGTVGQEASWAGGGIMSPLCSWDYSEAVTRLTQRSMGMLADTAAMLHATTGIDTEYTRSGMLLLPPLREELATRWCAQHQVELHRVAAQDHLPGVSGNALLMPDIAQVRNPRLLAALRRRVEMLGGVILEHHEVQKFEITGQRVTALHTSGGKLSADAYVVAAGAWSKVLLGEQALQLDVRPIRGQILLFKFDTPPFSQIVLQGSLYFIPRRDGHMVVGSTLEDTGFDKSTTQQAFDDLLGRVRTLFPDWPQPIRHWAGLRPSSKDNIPTIGRHPELANLYANCGHFRYGVTMSPACAELLVNEIEGNPQPLAMDEYRWQ